MLDFLNKGIKNIIYNKTCGKNMGEVKIKTKKMKRLRLVILCIVVFILVFLLFPVRMINSDIEGITRIEIFNGNTGGQTVITNEEKIVQILEDFQGVYCLRFPKLLPTTGINLQFFFYNEDEQLLDLNLNDWWLGRRGPFYHICYWGGFEYDRYFEMTADAGENIID